MNGKSLVIFKIFNKWEGLIEGLIQNISSERRGSLKKGLIEKGLNRVLTVRLALCCKIFYKIVFLAKFDSQCVAQHLSVSCIDTLCHNSVIIRWRFTGIMH